MRERDICKVKENDTHVHLTYHPPSHQIDTAMSLCGRKIYSWPRLHPHDERTWSDLPLCPKCEKEADRIDRSYFSAFSL